MWQLARVVEGRDDLCGKTLWVRAIAPFEAELVHRKTGDSTQCGAYTTHLVDEEGEPILTPAAWVELLAEFRESVEAEDVEKWRVNGV